jgi:hypothetical protein
MSISLSLSNVPLFSNKKTIHSPAEKLASGTGGRVKFQEKTLEQEIKIDAVLSDY